MIFLIVFFLQLLSIFIWGFLVKTYSVIKFADVPFFALDKILGHFNSSVIQNTLIAFICLASIYFINLLLIKKIKNRSLSVIFVILVLISIVFPIFIYPVGAIDIFDYMAQSKLFYFYHQNPYTALYSSYPNDIYWNYAGFLSQNLIYGPVWLITTLIPNLFIKFNLFLLLLTAFFITKFFSNRRAKIFSWYFFIGNPLVLFEILTNGHNDILIALFLVLSIFYFAKKPHLSFIFLTLASLVKIYFVVLLPLFLLRLVLNKSSKKLIIKLVLYSLLTLLVFYLPFIINTDLTRVISSVYHSQNLNTYSVYSLIREYIKTNNLPQTYIYLSQIIIFFIFGLISTMVIKKLLKQKIVFSLIIIINTFIILLTLSHPWYFIVSIALMSCFQKPSIINAIFVFFISFFLLSFYPASVWFWFNSGFSVSKIHLFQSLFIIPVILSLTIYYYLFSASKTINET